MNTYHFDVNAIIKINVVDKSEAGYKWLPRKEVSRCFGLLKNNVYVEGFYDGGNYDNWLSTKPYTKEELENYGYIVDSENIVWHKPYVVVYLTYEYRLTKYFQTIDEANLWVKVLKNSSGKTFEIVSYQK
jgi:hypothetical protein